MSNYLSKTISYKNNEIVEHSWSKNQESANVLIICHGIGEHGYRYKALANFLTDNFDIHIKCLDLPAHGLSRKKSKKLLTINEYAELINHQINLNNNYKKIHLFGHSMGGLISCYSAMFYQPRINSLSLSAPALKIANKIPNWQKVILKIANKVYPNFQIHRPFKLSKLSNNQVNQQKYLNDPLIHQFASFQLIWSFVKCGNYCLNNFSQIKYPTNLMWSELDSIIDPSACRLFYESLNCPKQKLVLSNSKHEIFNDDEKEKCYHLLLEWIKKHN